jgi:hypothetical protein
MVVMGNRGWPSSLVEFTQRCNEPDWVAEDCGKACGQTVYLPIERPPVNKLGMHWGQRGKNCKRNKKGPT